MVLAISAPSFGQRPAPCVRSIREAGGNPPSAVSNASISDPQVAQVFGSLDSGTVDGLFVDDYYEGVYFSNLRGNIGNNSHGSCSYVALGMLLSFYDSYWSDSFVPEQYDVEPTSDFVTYPSADFSFPSFYAESPGVSFEPPEDVGSLSMGDYLAYVSANSGSYFQCELISLSRSYFGSERFDGESNPLGMTFAEMLGFLAHYLYDCRGFTTSQVLVDSCNDANLVRSYAVNKIKNGVPVILRSQSSSLGGHAFIAYDYDEDSDEIYVHTGWRDDAADETLSHVSLSSTGFTTLCDAISLDVLMPPSPSFNYRSASGGSGSAQGFAFPQDVEIASGNYRDELPTFAWKSAYKERWMDAYDPYFGLSVLDSSSNQMFKIDGIRSQSVTLSSEQWGTTLGSDADTYYAYVQLDSATYPYWDDYYTKKAFKKPLDYNRLPQMRPNEYGFADAYPSDDSTKNDFVGHTASHGFAFETRRLRTGYIHDEYLVMSPIRDGFREAYIEYRFSYAVTRIDVELAHWRKTSHEWLTSSTGEASVQYYWENQWVDKLDLLSPSTALPTNRNSHKFYKIEFDNPVYRVRFHAATFSANANDDNRGRICIGDMAFYPSEYNLPLSGGELDYEPNLWSSAESFTNCYAYSLNVKINPYPQNMQHVYWALQPGTSDSFSNPYDTNYLTKSFLETMVEYDSVNYDFGFERIGENDRCHFGWYKVALVIAPKKDYHWYRQNSDGTWSHKPGAKNVRKVDYSGEIIYNPRTCDRRSSSGCNYSLFCGYYQVNIASINVNIY